MANLTSSDFHSAQQLELLQFLDVGLIVINCDFKVQLWNNFMSNHRALPAVDALNQDLFKVCPDVPEIYLRHKLQSVFSLKSTLTITWGQRPHLFKMTSYRPISSASKYMYQNIRIMPLLDTDKQVENVAIVIYDVTETARAQIGFVEKNEQLILTSRIDPLTNIFNRGHWESRLKDEFHRYSRSNSTSVLIMLDIDHFKQVNDTYGHQAGDQVLRSLGDLLTKQYRMTDIIGRYGGEEFGILLLDTDTKQALALVYSLTKALSEIKIVYEKQPINITLSFGLTEIDKSFDRHDQWIDMADKALYQSKKKGRNQATILNCTAKTAL
ncbi:MAG: hypothetical protein OFPII_31670 [Osedax symbiont Rs1]|nr:MAG: hypothetical protein OFPII_31670 [Osedax symbiont Rs1]